MFTRTLTIQFKLRNSIKHVLQPTIKIAAYKKQINNKYFYKILPKWDAYGYQYDTKFLKTFIMLLVFSVLVINF